jgi:DNA-binding MarR family transcriptional regulator
MGAPMHLTGDQSTAACSIRLHGNRQPPAVGGGRCDRCRPVPIPSRPPFSDTGSVSTYPPPPLAPSNGTTTVRRPHEDDRPPTARRDVAARYLSLDRFLESVHREHLSPVDLRVLLRVTDREATVRELADSMGQPPTVLRRASARLVAHGLLRRRRRPTRHHHLEVTLATTASGMSALCRVMQALGVDRAVAATPPELSDWPANEVQRNGDAAGRPSAATPAPSETGA